jgi:hypothetical protein
MARHFVQPEAESLYFTLPGQEHGSVTEFEPGHEWFFVVIRLATKQLDRPTPFGLPVQHFRRLHFPVLATPWDYLHAMLGIRPRKFTNSFVAREVYNHGPFPYPDLGLAAGVGPPTGALQMAAHPAPRAFLP